MNLNTELKTELRVLLLRFNVRNDGGPQHGLVTSDLTFYEANIKVRQLYQVAIDERT